MSATPDDPRSARVGASQRLLFPKSARQVCEDAGLNWWAALQLHAEGWLSFDPEGAEALDEARETELRFVAALVTGGCGPVLLRDLLGGLERPYCYDGLRIYYDWGQRRWRLLPQSTTKPESVFAEWLEALRADRDTARLEEIKAEADAILVSLRAVK